VETVDSRCTYVPGAKVIVSAVVNVRPLTLGPNEPSPSSDVKYRGHHSPVTPLPRARLVTRTGHDREMSLHRGRLK